jgi:uncharacterized protein
MRTLRYSKALMYSALATGSVSAMANDVPASPPRRLMPDALVSAGPSSEIPAQDRIYDPLIGSWSVRAVDIQSDGLRHESEGEWHFAYVLEGRAVQDVWIAPMRKLRSPNMPKTSNRYGTTVRFYEPGSRTWRLVWVNPVANSLQTLVGHGTADGIVQEGTDSEGDRIRWSFRELTSHSFHWIGEVSTDGGRTWTVGAEFFGRR